MRGLWCCITLGVLVFARPAAAQDVAVLQGLDKVTARVSTIDAPIDDRIRFAFRLCLVRNPQSEQIASIKSLYESESTHYQNKPAEARQIATEPLGPLPDNMRAADLAAWTVVCRVERLPLRVEYHIRTRY